MKKLIFSLFGFTVLFQAAAQNYEKNISGIRVGMNVSTLIERYDVGSYTTGSRTSFHAGISDQILLTSDLPLYLETGLYITQKGGRNDNLKFSPLYLQIPLLINYHIFVGNRLSIDPFAGVYYALGVGGKIKYSSELYEEYEEDYFGRGGMAKRSDLGLRFGVGLSWRDAYLGLGYELGLMDTRKAGMDKLKNGCFTLTVGYNF